MNRVFQQSYHIPGTLAANVAIRFTAPFDMQLVHVSAVASNDSDATMTIGTSASAAAYLAACTIGDSGTPVEKARTDFVGDQFPHIAKDSVIKVVVGHGSNAVDTVVVITFTVG
jgi:hypothetical protein